MLTLRDLIYWHMHLLSNAMVRPHKQDELPGSCC